MLQSAVTLEPRLQRLLEYVIIVCKILLVVFLFARNLRHTGRDPRVLAFGYVPAKLTGQNNE